MRGSSCALGTCRATGRPGVAEGGRVAEGSYRGRGGKGGEGTVDAGIGQVGRGGAGGAGVCEEAWRQARAGDPLCPPGAANRTASKEAASRRSIRSRSVKSRNRGMREQGSDPHTKRTRAFEPAVCVTHPSSRECTILKRNLQHSHQGPTTPGSTSLRPARCNVRHPPVRCKPALT